MKAKRASPDGGGGGGGPLIEGSQKLLVVRQQKRGGLGTAGGRMAKGVPTVSGKRGGGQRVFHPIKKRERFVRKKGAVNTT